MPVYSYQAPDGRIVDLEGDSPATEQELEQVFSSLPPISQNQESVNNFIESQQRGPISKAGSAIGGAVNAFIVDPIKAVGTVTEGTGRILGADSPQTLEEALLTAAVPFSNQGVRNLAQTGIEGVGRGAFDLGNAINQLTDRTVQRFVENPLEASLRALTPGISTALNLLPRTPSQPEIDQFKRDQINSQMVEAVKSQPLVPEVIGNADLPTAEAIPLAASAVPVGPSAIRKGASLLESGIAKGISKVKSGAETIASRGIFKQPLNAAATEALGITPVEGSQNLIPVVKRSVLDANAGKIPTNISGQELLDRAADFKIDQYVNGLKVAEQEGLAHSTQSLTKAMEERILRDHPTYGSQQVQDVIDSVISENQKLFSKDYISPTDGQKAAVQINRDLNKTNPGRIPKTDAQINAETALSQELSMQGSEMYQASTGTMGTPNQDWGALKQARDGYFGELKSAQLSDAGKSPGGSGVPTTKLGAAAKVARKVGGRVLVPTNAENVSNSLIRTLNEAQARPLLEGPLDPIQQESLISRYRKPPPALPASASQSLDAQIEKLIKSYPKDIKSNPDLARKIAESELGLGRPARSSP